MAPVRAMVPVFVASPKVTLALLPVITPPRVTLTSALATILFVVPELKLMALVIVLPLVFNNKAPPSMVTLLVDKLVSLVPPEEIDKVPPLIVVTPL